MSKQKIKVINLLYRLMYKRERKQKLVLKALESGEHKKADSLIQDLALIETLIRDVSKLG